VIDVMFS